MIRIRRAILLALILAGSGPARADQLLVSAASSLTSVFQEIGTEFEAAHPGTIVRFSFGASGHILQQLAYGAPVDVFATADEETMDRALRQGLVVARSRVDFADNRLVLIVSSDAPAPVTTLRDLLRPQVKRIAFANPAAVPFARYAKEAIDAEHLWSALSPKFVYADNVRQSLAYVARGEVDAGFVYLTDAAIGGNAVRVAGRIPTRTPISYPVARTTTTKHVVQADAFIAYLRSPAARRTLAKYGFRVP